ncbi:MAG: hypothetical protein R6V35_05855 [Candidatus Nanohaloarchaea archaeon]
MVSYRIWDSQTKQPVLPAYEENSDRHDTYSSKKEAIKAFRRKFDDPNVILDEDRYTLEEQTRIGWAPVQDLQKRFFDDSDNLEELVEELSNE